MTFPSVHVMRKIKGANNAKCLNLKYLIIVIISLMLPTFTFSVNACLSNSCNDYLHLVRNRKGGNVAFTGFISDTIGIISVYLPRSNYFHQQHGIGNYILIVSSFYTTEDKVVFRTASSNDRVSYLMELAD